MVKDANDLVEENKRLIHERNQLYKKLNEANYINKSIKKDNNEEVIIADEELAKDLQHEAADQTFRSFVENMLEGLVTVHINGIILYSNSSFAKIFNRPAEELIGTNLRKLIPMESRNGFDIFLNDVSRKNSKLELSVINGAGSCSHFIVSINKLELQDLHALNLVWTDVSDQKVAEENLRYINLHLCRAMEERIVSESEIISLNKRLRENIRILEEANIELANFAHITSHDLQEPLRKMLTFSSILIHEYAAVLDEKGKGYINNMQNASAMMRNLLNDILEYSELSQKEISFAPTDLDTVVKGIFSNLAPVIKETRAKIIIAGKLPVIEANPRQMRQLFQNIINNSLKFRQAGTIPEITISCEVVPIDEMVKLHEGDPDRTFFRFCIKDNGIGFDPEYNQKIFTIFQKLNNHSIYGGTGIGLAICKKIVDQHKGYITAESEPGAGSTFRITLPLK
jgi:PAS domain S-box-containing protein